MENFLIVGIRLLFFYQNLFLHHQQYRGFGFLSNLLICLQASNRTASLKQQLASVTPLLEELRVKKAERAKQFREIVSEIAKITREISDFNHLNSTSPRTDHLEDNDLSLRRLNELQTQLRTLQKEKVWCTFVFHFGFCWQNMEYFIMCLYLYILQFWFSIFEECWHLNFVRKMSKWSDGLEGIVLKPMVFY